MSGFRPDPVLDTATSHALLRRVAREDLHETLRLYVPDDAVMFSMLDAHRSGFKKARQNAEVLGFPGVFRLAGGHAALFHSQCLAFSWAMPAVQSHQGIRTRFELVSQWIQRGLARVGVPAQIGAVPGEYCPGEYSVNSMGTKKIMGVGQRVIRGAAHVGGVIVVREADRARDILTDDLRRSGSRLGTPTRRAPWKTRSPVSRHRTFSKPSSKSSESFATWSPPHLDEETRALGHELIALAFTA